MNQLLKLAREAAQMEQRAATCAQHDYECLFQSVRARLRNRLGDRMHVVRILDFGCGYTYPLPALLQGWVGDVVGVDVTPFYREGWLQAARCKGTLRQPVPAVLSYLEHQYARRYFAHLQLLHGDPFRHRDYRLIRYDGRKLPFENKAFDVVISHGVLQELPLPLERYAEEMARVLRPGALIDISWRSFYSWGGHHLGEEEGRRNPWGHLLGGSYHPCLNRATPDDVLRAFSPWFTDLHLVGHDARYRLAGIDPDFQPEGAEYLTLELEERLSDYPRDWLVTHGYVLQGTRK